jgi:FAD/FMN-containing dehydrogenase
MLGGLGQCGIITKVVMRLMAAPTNVLFIKMDYDDFQSASADLALLAKDGRFHHLDGRGAGRPAASGTTSKAVPSMTRRMRRTRRN